MYFWTVISVVVNLLGNKKWCHETESLSAFAIVASEVVASLGMKRHFLMKMKNCGDFSIFLRALVNSLYSQQKKKEERKNIFAVKLLDCTKG